jgi:hypothetical protein
MRRSGWFLLAVGCGGGGPKFPDPLCEPDAAPWSPGTPIFTEATAEAGLAGVEGVRLVAVDFDGDGWIDLHVHRGSGADAFTEGGTRVSWLLKNDGEGGFIDVTAASGFRSNRRDEAEVGRAGDVVAFGDVDNDGDLDAFTAVNDLNGTTTPDQSELLINQGDGTFKLGNVGPWALDQDAPAGATFVDVDKDGALDLWVPRNSLNNQPQQDRLYRGDGAGGFTDVTESAGLVTRTWGDIEDLNSGRAHSNAWSAHACDLNSDGWPELLAASYGRAPNHLWQNRGDGTFVNRSVDSGYAYDANLDYSDNQFFLCFCRSNRSAPGCANAAEPAISCSSQNWRDPIDREPFRNGGNSGATTCADIDNDGHTDLLTGEIQHWWAGKGSDEAQILFNNGQSDVKFDRPGVEALGLTRDLGTSTWDKGDMTNTVLDFDNDGWLDVLIGSSDYPGTRTLLWHQTDQRSFSAVATDDFFEHRRSHGVVTADFDNDGDQDLVVGHSLARCGGTSDCQPTPQVRFFRNNLSGNALSLDLVGSAGSNRAAIGARILVAADGTSRVFEVNGGYGHYGAQNPLRVHIGLGRACEAEVQVRWPDGAATAETFTLPAGYRFRWEQGNEDGPTVSEPP